MKTNNLTIGKRIAIGLGCLIAIFLLLDVILIIQLQHVGKQSRLMATEIAPFNRNSGELLEKIGLFRVQSAMLGLTGAEKEMQSTLETKQNVVTSAADLLAKAKKGQELQEAIETCNQFDRSLEAYSKNIQSTIEIWRKINETQTKLRASAEDSLEFITRYVNELRSVLQNSLRAGASVAEVEDGIAKLALGAEMLKLTNEVRKANFEAQLLKEPDIFIKEINKLKRGLEIVREVKGKTSQSNLRSYLEKVESNYEEFIEYSNDYAELL
ncbi:MAG: hypothetical protein NZL93_01110, partial [Chthoniobacterales bacterium]|nr:hypothetical protein [Chthoniobacterales bacterium]